MSVIKCVYIEMKTEDFWPLMLDEIRHGTEVVGVYDATEADSLTARHTNLFDIEAEMEGK